MGLLFLTKNPQSFFKLILRFPYYGFCFGFTKDFKNQILPFPNIPQHDIFIGYVASLKNDLVVLSDSLCAHRKFINSEISNVSDSSKQEKFIIKLFYRIKMIFYAILRSIFS